MPKPPARHARLEMPAIQKESERKDRRRTSEGPRKRSALKRFFSSKHRFGIAPTANEDAFMLHELDLKARAAGKKIRMDEEARKLLDDVQKRGRARSRTMEMLTVRRRTSKMLALKFGDDTRPRYFGITGTAESEIKKWAKVRAGDSVEATMGIIYNNSPFPVQEVFVRIADQYRNGFKLFELDPHKNPKLFAQVAGQLMAKAESGEMQISQEEQERFRESVAQFNRELQLFASKWGKTQGVNILIRRQDLERFPLRTGYITPELVTEELKRKGTVLIRGKKVVVEA